MNQPYSYTKKENKERASIKIVIEDKEKDGNGKTHQDSVRKDYSEAEININEDALNEYLMSIGYKLRV